MFWENSQWAMVPETKTRRPLHIWSFQTRQKYEKYFIFKPQISSQLFKYWRHVDVHKYDYMPFHSIGIIYISHPISSKYLLSLSLKNTGLFQRYIYMEKPEITHNLVITVKLVLNLLSYLFLFRSSHRRYSVKKGVLKNFRKTHRKTPVLASFLNKVAGLRPSTLLKKRPQHRCFPVNFAKFLRTNIL